ncbi:hypothetical protein KFE25_003282 [Diacronema lutheri]|uniref:Cyclic nucleotide-binding domain-containing protein n=2 Tax=Diacronema lutheri TaxID=2081491 RepID=A0A8J5XHE6_DIALT|nr:hypothetical protein KFE25_003282 [Diacronema lutheri]
MLIAACSRGKALSHRLNASASPCAIKDGARLGTLSWRPCPLRTRETAEHTRELLANRCRLSLMHCTRVLLRGNVSVLKMGRSNHAWAQSSADATSLIASMLGSSARSSFVGGAGARTLREWLHAHRWTLAANAACSLQMIQWAMDDVLYLRSINILAICFFTLYNAHMGAWIYISWDAAYTLINMIQIYRIVRERREAALLPWQHELHASVFQHGGLSTHHTRALLRIAEPEQLLRAGERLIVAKGAVAPDEPSGGAGADDEHLVGLVLSGSLRAEVGGEVVGFVDECGWYGHVQFNVDEHPAVTLVALEPTRLLQWSSARLSELVQRDACVQRGLHELWNDDMGRLLSKRDDDFLRRRSGHYARVIRALTASAARVTDGDIAHVLEHRRRHGIDDATHEATLDELEAAGALEPHALHALRRLRLDADDGDGDGARGALPYLSRVRRFVSSQLTSMAMELAFASAPDGATAGAAERN